uniref:Uncharacterized protein n=1 Tax=Schistocephalus solidus TaxID=70667 RepID=A0A0V0J7B2_SCHSO
MVLLKPNLRVTSPISMVINHFSFNFFRRSVGNNNHHPYTRSTSDIVTAVSEFCRLSGQSKLPSGGKTDELWVPTPVGCAYSSAIKHFRSCGSLAAKKSCTLSAAFSN